MKKQIKIKPGATIHLIGICGTGMGALAGLLQAAGYTISGSDAGVYPPMSDMLANCGIVVSKGYGAHNLKHNPNLVVVGNVCRRDHVEAVAAREMGLYCVSMPRAVHDLLLPHKTPLVVAGTHGKTTTSALLAYLLEATGKDPSVLVGGVTRDFKAGFKLGAGTDFVIEGDEYDSAYFEKVPKFMSYAPSAAIITSVEHDHIDIYPSSGLYLKAFESLVGLVSKGPLVVYAGDEAAMSVAKKSKVPVITYAVAGETLFGDSSAVYPHWKANMLSANRFELQVDSEPIGVFETPLVGDHNVRNTLAALIVAHTASSVPLDTLREVLPLFGGVARRQQIIGSPGGITVYDDFAHHPTAVRETLAGLKTRHAKGKLIAAFEPRSATACRKLHQETYVGAFDEADLAIIAPVGRDLPKEDCLDTALLAQRINKRGVAAISVSSADDILKVIVEKAQPGDGVVLMSNGSFLGLHQKIIKALS